MKRLSFAAILLCVAVGASTSYCDDWAGLGGDAGMTRYSPGDIQAGQLQQVYKKRFYSKWTNWTGSYGAYETAVDLMIRNGQAIVFSNDAPDTAGDYGSLYYTQFDWQSGATTYKSTFPGSPDGSSQWFHGGENPAEIDSNHFAFPAVWAADGRVYARRGGDQRCMGAMDVATHTWTYLPPDGGITGWAGDAASFINVYGDKLLYHPGDTRYSTNYVAADISPASWSAGTPASTYTTVYNSAPRVYTDWNDGLRNGDIPKAAMNIAVVAGWGHQDPANPRTYITATNLTTGQQLWTKDYAAGNVGANGFYTDDPDYWQYLATEDGHYAMFNRVGNTSTLRMLDLQTGNEKWTYALPTSADRPLMAYNGDYLYVVSRGVQMKVNADTGAVAWKTTTSYTGDGNASINLPGVSEPTYRPIVLTDDSMWFINNGAGSTHTTLVGLSTADGSVIQTLDLTALVAQTPGEQLLAVQDMVAADGKLGVLIDVKNLNDTHTSGSNGPAYQDLYVFQTTPEPATMTLLALGAGLVLRRRR